MSEQLTQPSETSIGNSLAASEYTTEGYESAPEWRDFSNLSMQPTGEQQDLGFLEEPYNPSWPESRKNRWEEYNLGGVATTPAGAARRTLEEMDSDRRRAAELASEQRKAEMQGATPTARAELASAQADAAAKQAEIQEAYRQEVEYQRSLATINDSTKSSAERNAARMQLEALAASIGKRMNPKLGTSNDANTQAKNLAGYIGAVEFKFPYSDFAPRVEAMQRGSQERSGLYRQQMEAAKVPVPDIKPPEAATQEDMRAKTSDMVMSMAGVKDQSGNVVMIGNSPIIKVPEAGKPVYKKRGPGGGWINLTQEEVASLGAQ